MNLSLKKPLVSVILASYNHEDFVKEAIMSVLNQSVESLELIVVDDGSPDKTPEVIKKIKDKRIKFIPIKENRLVHPRNLALKMARGKYVAFQNSDDVWVKGKLIKQLEIMEKDPSISACFTDVESIDEKGKTAKNVWTDNIFDTENKNSEKWLRKFFESGNCLCISSALVRRRNLKQVGPFRESFIQLSDFDMWVRLASVGNIHVLNDELTKMRVIEGKNLSGPSPKSHRRFVSEYIDLLERYTEDKMVPKLKGIFGESLPDEANTKVELLGGLAKYSWTLTPIHFVFANRLVGRIIDDPKSRKELTDFCGAGIIKEYINQKSRVDIGVAPEE